MKEYINPEVNNVLVEHCAPVLLRKKPAALFTLPSIECLSCLKRALKNVLLIKVLRRYSSSILIIVYDRDLMREHLLKNNDIRNSLKSFGYDLNFSVKSYLSYLKYRFQNNEDFPHEIGLFLGYPPEDVFGFIRNKGQEYKYCGFWKVYGDEELSRRCFDEYKYCGDCLRRHLSTGGTVSDFNVFYKIDTKEKKEGGNFYE